MNQDKIKSYIGFAIKSRKIKYGVDELLKMPRTELIILSSDLAENSKKKINSKFEGKTQIIEFKPEVFKFFFGSDSIKVAAITDKNLSEAIIKQEV